jgi:uncharacterized protein YPO0396
MVDDYTDSAYLIERYQRLCDDSDKMLSFAKSAQWDVVATIQDLINAQFRQLVDDNSEVKLNSQDRALRMVLLKRVVENDAQIRRLARSTRC